MSILAFPLPLCLRRGGNSLLRLLFWGAKPSARSGEATRAEVNRKAEALLDAHGSSILRLAYAYLHNLADAEEVLQDTMVKYLQTAPELHFTVSADKKDKNDAYGVLAAWRRT